VVNAIHGGGKRVRQHARAGAIALQQVKRHALGGFGADAGQTTQRLDELFDQ
jgi:hypothetical protein